MLESRAENAWKMNESSSITLLQLIQEVAYCDGSMSQDEEDLIISLIDSHNLQEDREAMKNRHAEDCSLLSKNKSVARGSNKRIDRNELWIDIAVEPVKAAEFIYVPVRIFNTGELSGS